MLQGAFVRSAVHFAFSVILSHNASFCIKVLNREVPFSAVLFSQ